MPAQPQFLPGVQSAVGSLFALYAEFLDQANYFRAGEQLAAPAFLVMPVPAALVDGTTVLPNDERLLFDAAELADVDQPRPGDYLVEPDSGLRRDVITAHVDVTGTIWSLVTRRVFESAT